MKTNEEIGEKERHGTYEERRFSLWTQSPWQESESRLFESQSLDKEKEKTSGNRYTHNIHGCT